MIPEHFDPSHNTSRRIGLVNKVLGTLGTLFIIAALIVIESDFVIKGKGVVGHEDDVPVFARRAGVVTEVFAKEGNTVEKGSPILRLADPELEARHLALERERARLLQNLATARQRLEIQKIQPAEADVLAAPERLRLLNSIIEARSEVLAAIEILDRQGLASKFELRRERVEKLQSEIQAAEAAIQAEWLSNDLPALKDKELEAFISGTLAEVEALEKELEWIKAETDGGLIHSPIAGRLAVLEFRYPGMAVPEGGFLFRVIDPSSPKEVEAYFDQRDIDLLRPGLEARVQSAVNNSLVVGQMRGSIAEIAMVPETGPDGPVFEVELTLEEDRQTLVPGSEVEVEILLGRRSLLELIRDAISGTGTRERLRAADESAEETGNEPPPRQ